MSTDIFGCDETIETTGVVVKDVVAPAAIRKEHKQIGADMIQRVQLFLDRGPKIKAYSVEESWSKNVVENIKLELDGVTLNLSLTSAG